MTSSSMTMPKFSKKDLKNWRHNRSLWSRELKELGWQGMLMNRLRFQHSLRLSDVAECTGRCKATVRNHFRRLASTGLARMEFRYEETVLVLAK